MTIENAESDRNQLEQAMVALESQRAVLGDAVVNAALASIQANLQSLSQAHEDPSQRKMVTILFMDIAGSTSIAQSLDPEYTMVIMDTALRRLADPVVSHGGRVTRYMGDGFLALFGAPVSRENDPEMAVRAGLGILAEAKRLARELQSEWQIEDFDLRIGINTGPAFIGGETEAENTIMGPTVNLAARLESAAEPGMLLISHSTYHHVRDAFYLQRLEPIRAKGFDAPVQVYKVQGAKPRSFRLATFDVAGVETPMVGRGAELLMLQDMCRDMTEDAEVRVVTIMGDAGVGKSRLLYEFESWLNGIPQPIRFFKARATLETEAMPYGLIRRMFTSRFEILESDSTMQVRAKFRGGMAGSLEDDQADLVGQLLGLDFSESPAVRSRLGSDTIRELATEHLIRYFQIVASEPTVVLFEDIHWADDSSLDLLDRLVAAITDRHLLVVCLARPTLFERRPSWGEGHVAYALMNLRPLSRRAGRCLVEEVLRQARPVPENLRDLIVEASEGNPYYICEFIKMLIEDGVVVCEGERWRVEADRIAGVRVPPTLTGILQARLDSLPPAEKRVLQRASVVGRQFWSAAVAELTRADLDQTAVDDLLEDARDRELIFKREQSVFEETAEYIFSHSLLRDVTYETVLLRKRCTYHALVAQWLESAAGERIGEYLSLIAGHYQLAGKGDQAAELLGQLGEDMLQVGAFRDAVRALEHALALVPDSADESATASLAGSGAAGSAHRAKLLVNLGNANNRVGEFQKAAHHLDQALQLARKSGNRQVETAALNRLAQLACEQGSYDTAKVYLDEALRLARELGDLPLVASTLAMLSTTAWRWGDLERAEACSREALDIYQELRSPAQIAHMLNILGILATLQSHYELAERYYERGLTIAREVADRQETADLLANLGYLHHYKKANLEKAEQFYVESLQLAKEIGHRSGATSCLNNLGHLHLTKGSHRTALKYLQSALAESVAIGAVPLTLEALAGIAQYQCEHGRPLEAAEIVGLVLDHPALEIDVGQVAEIALGKLRAVLPAEQLDEAMQRGRALILADVVANLEKTTALLLKDVAD